MNASIQTIKKRTFGFRDADSFKTAIDFLCSGLDLYAAPMPTHTRRDRTGIFAEHDNASMQNRPAISDHVEDL